MKNALIKTENKKDILISCRVTKKVYDCYVRWGHALHAGTKDGQCELASIAVTFMGNGLMEIESEINNLGKKLDDILKLKERWITNPVFIDLFKNEAIKTEVTDEVLDFILRTLNEKQKLQGRKIIEND
jgi:hypothetical protein